MTKTAWGAGAWAAEAERAEAEKAATGGGGAESFPSLGEAAAKAAKQKKKKGQTLSFSEFAAGVYVGPGGRSRSGGTATGAAPGLTTDERMMLPTRPRERSAAEEAEGYRPGRLGGGFRDYGRGREGAALGNSGGSGGGEWGSNRRPFDNDNRRPSMRSDETDIPSRADEVNDWAVSKKSTLSPLSRSDYVASRADGPEDWGASKMPSGRVRPDYVASRVDGVEDWGASKKLSVPPPRRIYAETRADEADDWAAGKKSISVPNAPPFHTSHSGTEFSSSESPPPRPQLSVKVNPFGEARPREEVLAQKGQDWKKLDAELETRSNASRPTSAHSSRPTSAHSSRPQSPLMSSQFVEVTIASRVRSKVNPFGDAKPREILLEQRGKDYRKMDFELEHRSVDRSETEEEQKLKEEINALKELAKGAVSVELKVNDLDSGEPTLKETQPTLKEKITLLEKQLELLIRALDDNVRFGKKGGGSRPGSAAGWPFEHLERPGKKDGDSRPGSAAGRPFEHSQRPWKKGGDSRPGSAAGHPFEYLERPGSRSGLSDAGKSDSFESPRSRIGGDRVDVWTRANEERRGMYIDRERTFPDRNRLTSRERWWNQLRQQIELGTLQVAVMTV